MNPHPLLTALLPYLCKWEQRIANGETVGLCGMLATAQKDGVVTQVERACVQLASNEALLDAGAKLGVGVYMIDILRRRYNHLPPHREWWHYAVNCILTGELASRVSDTPPSKSHPVERFAANQWRSV